MKIKKVLCAILAVCMIMCLAACGDKGNDENKNGGDNTDIKEETREMTNHAVYDGVALPDSLWQAPEYKRENSLDRKESDIKGDIQAIYYRSDYNGEESYAFAFLGIPDGASEQSKVPAVLLVHGGGGTAYWQWVKEWVNRGYVALAMDLEGHVPLPDGTPANLPAELYTASEYTAPHNTNYGDAAKPIEETWMYYAVSTAIRGNSLLHSLPYVNKYKVGVCGVSWGGVITSIITGYDDRFAFSAPIYCSLNMREGGSCNLGGYYKNHAEAQVWDDDTGLSRVNTPLLLIAMNDDPNSLIDSLSWTVESCKNGQIALVRSWAHSHSHAFARQEPYVFADSVVKGGAGLIKITGKPSGASGAITFSVPEGVSVKAAYIAVTNGTLNKIPSFDHYRLEVKGNSVSYEITDEMGEVTWAYIWIEDNLNRVVSTVAVEMQ